jgi:hypothetical protein
LEDFHIETTRQGLLVGTAPNNITGQPGQSYASQMSMHTMAFEGCMIPINLSNCNMSDIRCLNIQGHDIPLPEGPSWAFCAMYLSQSSTGNQIECVKFGSGFTQGGIVCGAAANPPSAPTQPFNRCVFPNDPPQPEYGLGELRCEQGRHNIDCWYPANAVQAGARSIKLIRGKSVQLPQGVVAGTSVGSNFGNAIPTGTIITSIDSDQATIHLSNPTTGYVDGLRFYDSGGHPIGTYDWRYPAGGQGLPGTINGSLVPF